MNEYFCNSHSRPVYSMFCKYRIYAVTFTRTRLVACSKLNSKKDQAVVVFLNEKINNEKIIFTEFKI